MANNISVGPNSRMAIVNANLADMGLTEANTNIIYEAEGTYKSWIPGRDLNAFTTIVQGKGYIINAKQAMDLTAFFGDDPVVLGALPPGGTANQVLAKIDNVDSNAHWVDPAAGSTVDQEITEDSTNAVAGGAVYASIQEVRGEIAEKADAAVTINGHAISANVEITPEDLDLGNVDNTSDLNKPISTATQAAIDEIVAGGGGLTLGETSTTAFRGDQGKVAYDHSQITAGNPHGTTKTDLSLGNVDNTSDANKPVSTAQATAIALKANTADVTGALANKADLVGGLVPSAQLPAYVDDVIEVANFAALPGTGETGKIYVTTDDNKQFRWSGSAYIELVASPGTTDNVVEGTTNKYWTAARTIASALTGFIAGVGNTAIAATDTVLQAFQKVEGNIADLYTNTALKANINNPTFTGTVAGITKGMVGLDSVDNTADTAKPVSTAQATAIGLKVDKTTTVNGHALSGNVAVTAADLSLGNVSNTADSAKPVSTAQQSALDLKADIAAAQVSIDALTFTKDSVSGTLAAPRTGNITGVTTGAVLGAGMLVIHNSATAPTFDSKFHKLSGSGSYVTSAVNYIYCQYIDATHIVYSINQSA